jgi:DNA-binding beta-propeller fold protein YncE
MFSALLILLALLALPVPALAEIQLPRGFTIQVYVTGEKFDGTTGRQSRGMPSASTLGFDESGALFLARSGRRYVTGEADGLWPIYRIPPGGARLSPQTESKFFHGPPLWNPQVIAVRGGRELLVTTFERDRMVGILYRMQDGRPELLAGGAPEKGTPAMLRQPEGAAADSAGNLFVADRDQGAVLRLDPKGRVLDPKFVALTRPRVLAVDEADHLWIAADGSAEAPWNQGTGEIWRVSPQRESKMILRGPLVAGMAAGPSNALFVADRQGAKLFVLTPEGERIPFADFTDGDAPRGLTFAPVTPGTQKAGIAGDLFVVVIGRGSWPVNEIVRISGPFEELVRRRSGAAR